MNILQLFLRKIQLMPHLYSIQHIGIELHTAAVALAPPGFPEGKIRQRNCVDTVVIGFGQTSFIKVRMA